MNNLFAWTHPGGSLPGYISINKINGKYVITVRQPGQQYGSELYGTPETLEAIACELMANLDGEPAPVAQAGWKLVPVEPTIDMLMDGVSAQGEADRTSIRFAYAAMLAASPSAAASEPAREAAPLTDSQLAEGKPAAARDRA